MSENRSMVGTTWLTCSLMALSAIPAHMATRIHFGKTSVLQCGETTPQFSNPNRIRSGRFEVIPLPGSLRFPEMATEDQLRLFHITQKQRQTASKPATDLSRHLNAFICGEILQVPLPDEASSRPTTVSHRPGRYRGDCPGRWVHLTDLILK
jgi:hypothetical protein